MAVWAAEGLPVLLRFGLIALLVIDATHWLRVLAPSAARRVCRLTWLRADAWQIDFKDGTSLDLRLTESSAALGSLLILHFRGAGRRVHCLVDSGGCNPAQFRRMKGRLRLTGSRAGTARPSW